VKTEMRESTQIQDLTRNLPAKVSILQKHINDPRVDTHFCAVTFREIKEKQTVPKKAFMFQK